MIFRLSDSATQRRTGVGKKDVRQDRNRCMQKPLVSQSIPRYLSTLCTHSLAEGTVHDFSCFERPVSTTMGRTDRMSILQAYSIWMACEKKSLQALVAEQAEIKGMGYQPATEERLIIALLLSLASNLGMRKCERKVMGRMLTFISLSMRLAGISWKTPIFEIPTLLTKMETSKPFSPCMIPSKKPSRPHQLKSATMYLVWTQEFSSISFIFARAASILLLLRAIMQMLNPRAANYWQNPSPMPSLPPVTTAQDFSPQRSLQFLLGRTALMSAQSILEIQMMKTMPPMTARKQMKLRVESSIVAYLQL